MSGEILAMSIIEIKKGQKREANRQVLGGRRRFCTFPRHASALFCILHLTLFCHET
jgi:hypothetical protein